MESKMSQFKTVLSLNRDLTTWEQIIEKVIIRIENWNVFMQVELFGIFG